MGNAEEIARILDARNRIREYLVSLGQAQGTERINELVSIIENLSLSSGSDMTLERIEVTPPNKIAYTIGDALNLSGIKVMAYYSKDVTGQAVFSPANGTILNDMSVDSVRAVHTEGDVSKEATTPISVKSSIPFIVYGSNNTELQIDDIANLSKNGNASTTLTVSGVTIKKSDIKEVHLSGKYTKLPDYFCNFFTGLQKLDGLEGITSAGNYVLSACTLSHQLALPDGLTTIGDNFLNASQMNQKIVLPDSLASMGGLCFSQMTKFNSQIIIGSGALSIGQSFLSGNTIFNQPLTLPANITALGANFMQNNNAMTKIITVECDPSVTAGDIYSMSTSSNSSACYTTGIKISGTNKSAWMTKFPNRGTSPYRKLVLS